jgi:hypothetical protein
MSIEVAPPMLIDRPGRRVRRSAWMILRLAKSGSQTSLAWIGACWPSAEKVIWLPRSSIRSPQVSSGTKPVASSALSKAAKIPCFCASSNSSA